MKQSPHLQEAQENMRAGVISLDGFLGKDNRNLIDILLDDEAEVRRLETSNEKIADKMAWFLQEGKKGLGEFISVASHFEVKVESVRGKIPSPFKNDGIFPKINVTVCNKEIDETVTFSALNIHLIRNHGFYEGKGAHFRQEPEKLVRALEVPIST